MTGDRPNFSAIPILERVHRNGRNFLSRGAIRADERAE